MMNTLLGGLSPAEFLRDYWQKDPLLIRGAFPGFQPLLSPEELAGLACEEEVEARIVQETPEGFTLQHGPFSEEDFARLPETCWTLLVQGVNLHVPEARDLLDAFAFLPAARLDDLMISYAVTGGSVGPHIDSYDVFLLQGAGRRRWQISSQGDRDLVEGAPIRLLKHFEPDQEWVLNPGDMLYLPPQYAHHGVALDNDCTTYSIGFRAPAAADLAWHFLGWLQDHLQLEGRYSDPDLVPGRPAEITAQMQAKITTLLGPLAVRADWVAAFLGSYLTEPKANVVFEPPESPLSEARFAGRAGREGLLLDLKSQLLYDAESFYLNGERITVEPAVAPRLRDLADHRRLPAGPLSPGERPLLYDWYRRGFLWPGA